MSAKTLRAARNRHILATGILSLFAGLSVSSIQAASGDWIATVGGGWGTAANWNPAAVPGSTAGDVVNINSNIAAAATITLDANRTVGTLLVGDADSTHAFSLTGNTLTLDQTGVAPALLRFGVAGGTTAIGNSIASAITLADNARIYSTLTGVQTMSGLISGAFSLTFDNEDGVTPAAPASLQGQFLISGTAANTYSLGTTIDDVRVQIQGNNAALGTGAVNILDGGQVFNSTGLTAIANTFNIAGNGWQETTGPFGALRLDSGAIVTGAVNMTANAAIGSTSGTGTVNGIISGTGFTLSKLGAGILALGGVNTYTGGTTISAGILQANNNSALGTGAVTIAGATSRLLVNGGVAINNNITINAGVTGVASTGLVMQTGTGQATVNGTISLGSLPTAGGTFFASNTVGNELVLAGAIDGTLGASQRDGRVIYRNATSTATGTLTATGTVLAGVNNGIPQGWTILLGGSGNATLNLNGFDQTLAGVQFGTTTTPTASGTIALGTKSLTLNSDLTMAGTAAHFITAGAGGNINFGAAPRNLAVPDNAAQDDLTVSGATLNVAGGLTKTGNGTLALNGATVNGSLNVTTGTLATGTFGAVGSATLSALNLAAGTTLRMKAGGDLMTITNAGGLTAAGTSLRLNQAGGALAVGTYPLISYTGASPGLGGFTLQPVGHVTGTLVDTGSAIALDVVSNDKIIWDGTNSGVWSTGATSNWKLATPLTATDFIESDDVTFTDSAITTAVTIAANVFPSKVTFTNTTTPYTVTGAAGIVGATGLTKTGNGTLTLANVNSFSGAAAIQAGTLVLEHSTTAPLAAFTPINVSAGATVKLSHAGGIITLVNPISGAGTVVVDPGTTTAAARDLTNVTWNTTGFTGTLNLKPTTGTMRMTVDNTGDLGAGSVVVDAGGQVFVNTGGLTFANNFTLSGTGYSEAAGTLGAIRSSTSTYTGTITINGAAKIGALGQAATFTNTIGGGTLTFGGSINNTGSETMIITNSASLVGLVVNDGSATSGAATILVNVGNGGATGTLGATPVSLKADGFKNAVLRFDRNNGYTLGAPISSAATAAANEVRNFLDLDTLGSGFNDGGQSITLGIAAPASGGTIRIGQARANSVVTLSGTSVSEKIAMGAAQTGAVLNILPGANITTNFFSGGEAANASETVNQTGGSVTVVGQLRAGHFGTETGTYNLMAGTLTLSGASSSLTPSTTGAGGANATGDNNINGAATSTIHGGGIYLGIDGAGIFNHTGGTVTTNWIVLDNRGDTGIGANMRDGFDRYNLSGAGSVLNLRSTWGLIQRNATAAVSFGGGTVRVDNTGTGGPTGNTGANLNIPLDANITVSADTTLDTNGATNAFTLPRSVAGTGTLTLQGGGTVNLSTAGTQLITAPLASGLVGVTLAKIGAGTTTLSGSGAGFTGALSITAGRLNAPSSLAASSINVAAGAALGGEPTTASTTLGGGTIFFDANTAGAFTAGGLTANGSNTLDFSVTPAGPGPWTALNYTTRSGAGTIAVANAGAYRSAPVINDTGSGITVDIATKNLAWTGSIGAIWDSGATANQNWNDGVGADNFFAGDTVTFGDGPANVNVTVTSGVSPWKTTVNSNTNNYTLTSATNGIAGPGNLEKSGNSTLTLVGPNTYSGQTVVSGGTLVYPGATSLGNGSVTNTVSLSNGGRMTYNGTTALDLGPTRNISLGTDGGTLAHNATTAAATTISGNLVGAGNLTLNTSGSGTGASTYILTGDNSGFTGNISVEATSTILTTLRYTTQSIPQTTGTITINYPPAGATGNANTLDLPAVTLPAGVGLVMTSLLNGTTNLRSQVTSSGTSIINGPIAVSGSAIVQINTAGNLTLNGPITAGIGGFTGNFLLRGSGTGFVNNTINLPGAAINKTDASTWTINSTGNVWGTLNVQNAGGVRLGVHNALPLNANLVIGQASDASNSLFDLNGFNQEVPSVTYIAGNANSSRAVTNTSATLSTFTVNNPGAVTYGASTGITGGFITGNLALVKTNTGTFTIASRANTYTGGTTVNDGILQIAAANAGNSAIGTGPLVINSGATVESQVNGFGFTDGQSVSSITINGGTLRQIAGGVGPDSHLYTGVTLNGGIITGATAANIFRFHRDVAVEAGAISSVLSVAGFELAPIAPGANAGTIANPNSITFTVADGAPVDDLAITGSFTGPGGLTKAGPGTMRIGSTSSYTGPTTVNAGTLLIDGSITGSATTINAGGILTGDGNTGSVALAGGTLAPGDTLLSLNTSDVTLGGGTFALQITGASTNTNLNVTGGITFTANTALSVDFSTYDPVDFVDTFTLALNDGVDGVLLGANAFTFAGNPLANGSTFNATSGAFSQHFQINYNGGDGNDVVLTAVPEPGSALLLLGGFGALIASRRARRRHS